MTRFAARCLGWRESSKRGQKGYATAVWHPNTSRWFSGNNAWRNALRYSLGMEKRP